MSRVVSSINSPSPGLFRTCRPYGNIRRTLLVPLRRTSVRPTARVPRSRRAALRPRRGPSWFVSYEFNGARATGVLQKGEESINIRVAGNPRLFISCSLPAYVVDRAKALARNCFYLLPRREKIETRTCIELLKAQQSVEYFSKQNVMKTDSTANEQKYSK